MIILGVVLIWRPGGAAGPVLIAMVLLGFISAVIAAFAVLTQRLFARSPQECWPVEPSEVACQLTDITSSGDQFG
jgi:hypothetical protein